MMERILLSILMSMVPVFGMGQTTLQTVDFETTAGYTVTGGQTTTPDDWWERATSAQVNPVTPFSGYQGSYFFYAEDTDNGRANDEPAYCTLTSTNVSSYTNLQIKILVAGKNDPGSAYEREEYLRIQYAFDGAAFTTRAQFIAANVDDVYMSEDANADGVADGPALSPAFAEFTYSIPSAGTSLQIRIMGSTDQAGEEFGFDNIRVLGTLAPTATPPTVTTAAATSIATNSATLGGDVTADGGATVSERGVVYALSSVNTDPLIGGTGVVQVQIGNGTGSFSQSIESFTQATAYHFNAYAINSAGTNYGTADSFTTQAESSRVVLYDLYLRMEGGVVQVCWQTASEEESVGFDLFRWDGAAWVKVNEGLVMARDPMGASYSVADAGANGTDAFLYKLVEVETDGGVREYGSFERAVWTPQLENVVVDERGVILRWLSRDGETYEVRKSSSLLLPPLPIAVGLVATPPVNEYTDPEKPDGAAFYQIRAE